MNLNVITPTASVALADKARVLEIQGKKIIKLQTGDPDFNTHPGILEAISKGMKNGYTHYSFSQGLPELRKLISQEINKEAYSDIGEENIIITQGAAQGLHAIFAFMLEANDEVLITEPNWPTVDSLVKLNGGVPVKINALNENNIIAQLELKFSEKTKAVCFNTPNNPTGLTLSQKCIDEICNWAIDKNIFIIADEVYRYFQYSEYTTSLRFIKTYDKYIFADSFSKKYAMTGLRIGYVATRSSKYAALINKASQLVITHVNASVQMGAIEAIQNEASAQYCNLMKETYNERRLYVQKRLDEKNLSYLPATGAFYYFIKINKAVSDTDYVTHLLENKNICAVPGSVYGNSGKGFYRITYAVNMETINSFFEKL